MKVGRDEFEVDRARQKFDNQRYDEGRGLIGGDPNRRPETVRWRPIPEEQPYFRLIDLSEGKRARLEAFLRIHSPPLPLDDNPTPSSGGFSSATSDREKPAPPLQLDDNPTATSEKWGGLEIEIGFGSGEFLLGRAAANPGRRFLGFEVKRELCRDVVREIGAAGLGNAWISDDDARWALPQLDLAGRVDVIHVLYPDPWWKRRHHAKRVFSLPFVALAHELLAPGGLLHVRTDVEGYARLIEQVVAEHGGFAPSDAALAAQFDENPPTRREAFCRQIGRPFWVMGFVRKT